MAKLTSAARKALPKQDFALPGKRAYPVPDAAHARNALARVAQHGTPAQQAQVKAKVAKKFPSIDREAKHPSNSKEFHKLGA
jgi:hypothetical protein